MGDFRMLSMGRGIARRRHCQDEKLQAEDEILDLCHLQGL